MKTCPICKSEYVRSCTPECTAERLKISNRRYIMKARPCKHKLKQYNEVCDLYFCKKCNKIIKATL